MHMYINIFLAFQVSQRGFSEQVNELKGSWNTQVQTSDASPPGAVPPGAVTLPCGAAYARGAAAVCIAATRWSHEPLYRAAHLLGPGRGALAALPSPRFRNSGVDGQKKDEKHSRWLNYILLL